jgi:hypothetical protein
MQSASDLMVMCSEHLHVWKNIYFTLLNVAVWRYNTNLMTSTARTAHLHQYNHLLRTASMEYFNDLWIEFFPFSPWRNSQNQAKTASMLRFLDHTRQESLNDRSARHRCHYIHNTQHTKETDVHVLSGIRIRNPSNREAANLRHRPHGHRDGAQYLVLYPTGFLVTLRQWGVSFRNKVIFMAWPQQTSALVTREWLAPIFGLTLLGNTFRRVVTLTCHSLTPSVLESGDRAVKLTS